MYSLFATWVGFGKPSRLVLRVLVVLLESFELLLQHNSTSVVEMVPWAVWESVHPLGHSCSVCLELDSLDAVADEHGAEDELEPEVAVFHVFHVVVVIHWVGWHGSVEVGLVSAHVVLELDGVLLGDAVGISVLVVEVVMNVRGMEDAWSSESIASDDSAVGSGHATTVVAKMVDVVLFSFLLKLSQPLLCVGSSGGLLARRYTSLVSVLPVEHHIELLGGLWLVELRVLLPGDVERCS